MKPILALSTAILLAISASAFAEAKVGEKAPAFTLSDINGKEHSLKDFAGKYVVLEWINHECPFVKKHYSSGNMQKLQKEYTAKDVVWLSICSSAEGKQGHFTADKWKEIGAEKDAAPTAVLLDESGQVGQSYGARTTPDMFVIDPEGQLIYSGAIDSIASADTDDVAKADNYVKAALDSAMAGEAVKAATTKSYGCSVKY